MKSAEALAWYDKQMSEDNMHRDEFHLFILELLDEQAAQWQPIATAPKDGTDILAMYMHIDTQIVHNAFWISADEDGFADDPSGWWTYDKSEVSRVLLNNWMAPTHWMPLPPAPKEQT